VHSIRKYRSPLVHIVASTNCQPKSYYPTSYFSLSRWIIVVKLISPRSPRCARKAFSALGKRNNLFGGFWQKENNILGFVFVIIAKEKIVNLSWTLSQIHFNYMKLINKIKNIYYRLKSSLFPYMVQLSTSAIITYYYHWHQPMWRLQKTWTAQWGRPLH